MSAAEELSHKCYIKRSKGVKMYSLGKCCHLSILAL